MVASLSEHADDASLVVSVQQGEPEAFAELFRRHWPDVRRLCARRMGSVVDGDEVAQAAFVKAFERIDQCGGERRFGAWVNVIAARLCADAGRSRGRIVLGEVPDERLPRSGGPEEALMRLEGAGEVGKALRTLPQRQREVVIARDIEGRRPAEIAAALGVSIGAVDSLLLRARRRLASVLTNGGEMGATNVSMAAASTVTGGLLARQAGSLRALGDLFRRLSLHAAQALGLAPGFPGASAEALAAAGLAAAVAFGGAGADTSEPPGDVVGQVSGLVPPADVPATPAVPEPAVAVAPPAVEVPSTPTVPPTPVPAPGVAATPPSLPGLVGVDGAQVVDSVVAPVIEEILGLSTAVTDDVQVRLVPVGH